jgi:predicted secreted Zn-dependent protease
MSDRLNTTAKNPQNLDSTFKVNPFRSRGFGVQAKSDESAPATKAQLWESYQQAKQLNQSGANSSSMPIQAKLTIGQPGDKYEQEADNVADRVMAMPPTLATTSVTNSVQQNRSSIEPIQRVCTDCQEEPKEESKPEEDGDRIQAKEGLGQTPELTSVRRKLDSADDPQSGSNSDSQLNGSQGKSILAITDRPSAQIQRAPDKMPPPTGTTTIDKQNETISASGNTLTEAITNLTSQGKGEAGRVTCAPDLYKQAWKADENKPAETVVTANVTITETKAMPVWTELDRQCEPVKKEWARFYQALDRHEEGHIKIDETSFQDLHKKLLGKTPAIADEIYKTTVTQANTKNDAYDATTQHGLTQGTAVTPVQCQAMEKVSENQESDGEGAEVQAKFSDSLIQRVADDTPSFEPDLESRLGSSKGGGSPLSDDLRSFMEPRFGADFSGVRVHTGSDSVRMNQDVNAKAFAYGQDVYFGSGNAPGKDVLTAHELTHVLQQTGNLQTRQESQSPTVQCKCSACTKSSVSQDYLLTDIRQDAPNENRLSTYSDRSIQSASGYNSGQIVIQKPSSPTVQRLDQSLPYLGPLRSFLNPLNQLTKFVLPGLSPSQKALLDGIFGNSLATSIIRINPNSILSTGHCYRTTGNIINIPGPTIPDHSLIHEAAHVWQSQNSIFGVEYALSALKSMAIAQLLGGDWQRAYDYKNVEKYKIPWRYWNAEQQADWIEHNRCLPSGWMLGALPDRLLGVESTGLE